VKFADKWILGALRRHW